LSDSYYNQNCLSQNTPNNNECTITRSPSQEMTSATLSAAIMINNNCLCTITKLVSTGNGFDGTYYDGLTTKPIDLPTPLYVLPGTSVLITSPNLIGAAVSQVGGNATPTSWNFNNSTGVLTIGAPSSSGMTIVLNVICSNSSTYTIPITTTDNGSGQLFISQIGNTLEISIFSQNNVVQSRAINSTFINVSPWTLEICNAMTGEKVLSEIIGESSHHVNTSNWKAGIYVIHAIIGKKSFSEKIVVK
jgi:hypothetical protein